MFSHLNKPSKCLSDDTIIIFFQSDSIKFSYFLSSLIKIKSFLNDIKIYCFPLLHQNRSIKLWNQTLKRKWIPPPLKITQICYSIGGTLLKCTLDQSIWHDGAHIVKDEYRINNGPIHQVLLDASLAHVKEICMISRNWAWCQAHVFYVK